MLSPLAAAMAACLAFVLPSGRVAFYAPLRAQGGAARIEVVAALVDDVARPAGVDPAELSALLIGENSALDPLAISSDASSWGLAQLNAKGKFFAAWRNACRAVPSRCEWAAVHEGARALREGLDACHGRFGCAVSFYRSGRVMKPRPRDLKVVRLAARIRALMGGAHG